MSKAPFFFIHISKNAGTSVEEFFKSEGLLLGRYDPFYSRHTVNWHTPPIAFSKELKRQFLKHIEGKTTFLIHRSPHDRVLSEMNCKWGNPKKEKIQSSKKKFNRYLTLYLIRVFLKRFNNILHSIVEDLKLIERGGIGDHWTPQSHYLQFFKGINNQLTIIPFELLNEGVSELFENVTLLPLVNGQHSSFKFKTSDMSIVNKTIITFVYLDDLLNHRNMIKMNSAGINSKSSSWWYFSLNSKWAR